MLPFLRKKNSVGGLLVAQRKPNGEIEMEPMESDEMDGSEALEAAAADIMEAINSKDIKRLASALQAAFEIMDAMPHEEGPHTNE